MESPQVTAPKSIDEMLPRIERDALNGNAASASAVWRLALDIRQLRREFDELANAGTEGGEQ